MAEKAAIHLVEPAERAAAVAANKMERGGRPASAAATPTHLLSSLTSINESVWERQPREREEKEKQQSEGGGGGSSISWQTYYRALEYSNEVHNKKEDKAVSSSNAKTKTKQKFVLVTIAGLNERKTLLLLAVKTAIDGAGRG